MRHGTPKQATCTLERLTVPTRSKNNAKWNIDIMEVRLLWLHSCVELLRTQHQIVFSNHHGGNCRSILLWNAGRQHVYRINFRIGTGCCRLSLDHAPHPTPVQELIIAILLVTDECLSYQLSCCHELLLATVGPCTSP